MNKKLALIFVILLAVFGIGVLLYQDISDSVFTKEEKYTEKSSSYVASAISNKIRNIIEAIPLKNELIANDETSYPEECLTRINKMSGSKDRECKKMITAYIGMSKNNLEATMSYLTENLASPKLGLTLNSGRIISSNNTEKELLWYGSNRNLSIIYQTMEKNYQNDNTTTEMLSRNEYVLKIEYSHTYSRITNPINIFEYL